MLRHLRKNKKLLLITVLVFLFGFAGIARAAYFYACNGGSNGTFSGITWYTNSLCSSPAVGSPNLDGTSNSVTISNSSGGPSTLTIDGAAVFGVDDTLTIGGGGNLSDLRVDTSGVLTVQGGTITLSGADARLTILPSGSLRYESGSIVVQPDALVENQNANGLELSFADRSVLQNTAPSDNNTNVLTLAGGSSYSISGTTFSAGEATFTVDSDEGLLVVNGTNDVDTQVAGTLNVVRNNSLGSLSQAFSFNFEDVTDPNVLTVSATADTYGPGDLVSIEVVFDDESTYVGGTDITLQRLYLSNGAYAEYVSGDSSDTHIYEYTVQTSDESTNSLEVVGFTDGDAKSISDSTDNWIYIKDLVFPAVDNEASLTAVMIDTEVPLNSKAPAHETTGVPVDTNITLTFAEIVSTVEGLTVTLLDQSSFVPVDLVYNVGLDPEISNFGGVVTINPEDDLLGGTTYSVVVQQGAFQDALGNEFVGISENEWVFTTVVPDTTPPTIQTLTPDDDATEVAAGSTFSIVFDEGIQLGAGSIRVYQAAGPTLVDTIPAAETTIIGGSTVEFTITGLQSEQLYYIQMDNDVFTDPSGNAFAGILNDTTWSFTTEDTVAPTVSSLSPTDNGVNVPPDGNLVISFDDDISLALGSGTLLTIYNAATDSTFETVNVNGSNVSIDGRDLIFNPTATLISGESYYVQITNNSVLDDGDNYYAGIADETTWNFTVDPKPTVSSFSPADDSVGIDLYANLVLTFSEGVSIGTGNIVIKKVSDNTTVETISVSSGQVTGGGTTEIMINPSVTLEDNTEYYIQIDEGAFIDGFSQSYAGIADETTWNFTVIDATDPGASGGGGGGSVYGDKPAKPSMSVRVLGGERVEISGTHQGDSENPTATFGYTYKAKTGKTKTVLLNRNVTGKVSFVEVLDGLTCGETYLIRVFAKNRAGTSAAVAEVTTAACDGSTEGEVVSTDSDETDPSVIADEAQAVQTAEAYQAVQDVVCSIFTTPTAPGESNADVPRIKLFLNFLFPGLNLDVTSLVYDDATVAATKRFQMQYADMILKPLGLTQATGFWYQATMRQAHKVLGCDQ